MIIYIHWKGTKTELYHTILNSKALPSSEFDFNIKWQAGGAVLFPNRDYEAYTEAEMEFPDHFYMFRYYLDLYADEDYPEEALKAIVAQLLHHLWEQGIPAVASGMEDEGLPDGSGYNDPNKPWPEKPKNK